MTDKDELFKEVVEALRELTLCSAAWVVARERGEDVLAKVDAQYERLYEEEG